MGVFIGTSGNDDLFGGSGDDEVIGGEGNDYLSGLSGNDRYIFEDDFGQDRIANFGASADTDVAEFIGVDIQDLWFSSDGYDLTITVAGTDNSVTITSWFVSSYSGNVIESASLELIQAGDVILNREGVSALVTAMSAYPVPLGSDSPVPTETAAALAPIITSQWAALSNNTDLPDTIVGGDNDDLIEGFGGQDHLEGKGGNDTVRGGTGNDIVKGNSGDDQLFGDAGDDIVSGSYGDDVLNGGEGDDYLLGYDGQDTYVFSGEFGQDKIANFGDFGPDNATYYDSTEDNDVIVFEDVKAQDLWLSRDADNLLINILGTDEQVTINNWFLDENGGGRQVDEIRTSSLTIFDHQVSTLVDAMESALGTNGLPSTVEALLQEEPEAVKQLVANSPVADVYRTLSISTVDADNFEGFNYLTDDLNGAQGNDTLIGLGGNDNLFGRGGDDKLIGGEGNDYLLGGEGNDRYLFEGDFGQDRIANFGAIADTDSAEFIGVDIQDLWFSSNGYDLTITVAGTDNSVRINSWFVSSYSGNVIEGASLEWIQAGDAILNREGVSALVTAMSAYPVPLGADNPVPTGTAAVLAPIITGQWTDLSAADTIIGGDNDDLIRGFGGADYLEGKGGNDTVRGGTGNDMVNGNAGDDQLFGDAGDDTLSGSIGDDVLNGGEDNDYLMGSSGDDTYVFSGEFGQDKIANFGFAGDNDVAVFEGYDAQNLWFSQQNNSLQINLLGTDHQVTINNWFLDSEGGNRQVDEFQTDSTTILDSQVASLVQAMSTIPSGSGIPSDFSNLSQADIDHVQLAVAEWA